MELPGSQQALVEAVAKANPNYVVVLINGGALGIDWIKKNSPAVVEAFYPSDPNPTNPLSTSLLVSPSHISWLSSQDATS